MATQDNRRLAVLIDAENAQAALLSISSVTLSGEVMKGTASMGWAWTGIVQSEVAAISTRNFFE